MMPLYFEFVNPEFFWLFLLLPVAVAWYFLKNKQQIPSVRFSSIKGFKTKSWGVAKFRPLLFVLKLVALSLFIIAMARPRTVDTNTRTKTTQGIDIVMAIDVSGSMLARDLRPNRLEALKEIAEKFVIDRPNDRIGIVLYAGETYTKVPLTTDQNILINAIQNITYGNAIDDGTAIGDGLATAVNRLRDSKADSKVIILLSDGENNTGFIDPRVGLELALAHNIRVHSIGIGSRGTALAPVAINPDGSFRYANVPVNIDEALLKEIAQATGGIYYRAETTSMLEEIYNEINQLETTEIEEFQYTSYHEKFRTLILWGGMLLLLEFLLRITLFRSFV